MSNEIKNTLFRFVSMRAPELVTEATTKPGFVFQDIKDKGIFNSATASIPVGSTKQAILKNTATNFKPNAKTVDGLKALNIKLYDFSVWLAKNRYSATEAEISAMAKLVTTTTLDLKTVWENLFYQVVTQSDFYAKEVAMQLLLAYHVRMSTTLGTHKERANAKVVLPKEVFLEEKTINPSVQKTQGDIVNEVPFASHISQKLENKALAEDNNKILQKLKIELTQAEVLHKKNYESQYQVALDRHQATIKPILEAYQRELEELKNNWCATQDPSKPLDPTNPCSQPPTLPQPELPEFNFPYDDTIDIIFLESVLSSESFEVYNNIVNLEEDEEDFRTEEMYRSSNVMAKAFALSPSFSNLTDVISDLTNVNNTTIQQNTIDTGSTAVIIGGSVITVPNTQSPLLPLQYEVKTRRRTLFLSSTIRTLQISLGIPDNNFKIAQVKYKMTRTDGTFVEKTSSVVQHLFGCDVLVNLSMTGITANLSEMFITFQFVNGQIITLSIPNFNLSSTYKGILRVKLDDTELPDGDGDTTGGNTTVAPDETFIPSGFGMKQIGVADYNKVEQTIQGYIEGEVAHIENIMAREFKEKSTRRLRRSEITETTSSETERENLTDTSTVDRFEMQSEVAKVIANSKDFAAGVQSGYKKGDFYIDGNANFATHNSKEESTRQAVTNAKEITERALDRIVTKVKEERIEKVLEEFEENNTHGFDNRKGDQHVVGVYRWVDKVYKNQIVNYGKRLMFEFAIPEPARLHWLAMDAIVNENNAKALPKPQDPRTSTTNKLENYSQLDNTKLEYWAGIYNISIPEKLDKNIAISHSFNQTNLGVDGGRWTSLFSNDEFKIPEKYYALDARGVVSFGGRHGNNTNGKFFICGRQASTSHHSGNVINIGVNLSLSPDKITDKITVSGNFWDVGAVSGTLVANCQLLPEVENQWKQETFNAIIKAYEDALEKYNQAVAQEAANGVQILGTNPGFYREIENTILRKNCISYMISSNPNAKLTFGQDFYDKNKASDNEITFNNATIKQTAELDNYASFVKFMEQAFEWDIMSYYFYPFYWGKRNDWAKMYQYDETHDHIFKAFMQSGMARVIVTVRPGFEEAVRYYMQTGQIWNGGEVPVIGDELYLSIVEEMRVTVGEKVGKAWPTRVPTSMTILQADSIGLKVEKALPYNDDLSDFEDENEVPKSTDIKNNPEAQIGVSSEEQGIRHIENIDINNGYLQLTTDDTPRQIVAQISVQAIKNAIDQTTNP